MIYIHDISPFLIQFSEGIGIRWYGIMYAIGFLIAYLFWQRNKKYFGFNDKEIDSLLFISILGVIFGGRFGYILFYNPSIIWTDFLEVFQIWKGGMSIHGGFIGVILGVYWFSKKYNKSIFQILDFIVIPASFALVFGRIGNFINGELIGYPTGGEWGVVYPLVDDVPRHPSQLYASGLNLILGIFLYVMYRRWNMSKNVYTSGLYTGIFATGYGAHRFIQETFWRIGDWYYFGLSPGQWYSLPVFFLGLLILLFYFSRKFESN